jgi:hypothetical protein
MVNGEPVDALLAPPPLVVAELPPPEPPLAELLLGLELDDEPHAASARALPSGAASANNLVLILTMSLSADSARLFSRSFDRCGNVPADTELVQHSFDIAVIHRWAVEESRHG